MPGLLPSSVPGVGGHCPLANGRRSTGAPRRAWCGEGLRTFCPLSLSPIDVLSHLVPHPTHQLRAPAPIACSTECPQNDAARAVLSAGASGHAYLCACRPLERRSHAHPASRQRRRMMEVGPAEEFGNVVNHQCRHQEDGGNGSTMVSVCLYGSPF